MSNSQEINNLFQEFKEEIKFARLFLTMLSLRLTKTQVASIRPLTKLQKNSGSLRDYLPQFSVKMYQAALNLILIYCFSCLEVFLRRLHVEKFGKTRNVQRKMFSNPECFLRNTVTNPSVELLNLAIKAQAVAQKRHILVHNDGIIDARCMRAFEQAHIVGYNEGEKLELTVADVKNDITTLEDFATSIKEVLLKH